MAKGSTYVQQSPLLDNLVLKQSELIHNCSPSNKWMENQE